MDGLYTNGYRRINALITIHLSLLIISKELSALKKLKIKKDIKKIRNAIKKVPYPPIFDEICGRLIKWTPMKNKEVNTNSSSKIKVAKPRGIAKPI